MEVKCGTVIRINWAKQTVSLTSPNLEQSVFYLQHLEQPYLFIHSRDYVHVFHVVSWLQNTSNIAVKIKDKFDQAQAEVRTADLVTCLVTNSLDQQRNQDQQVLGYQVISSHQVLGTVIDDFSNNKHQVSKVKVTNHHLVPSQNFLFLPKLRIAIKTIDHRHQTIILASTYPVFNPKT